MSERILREIKSSRDTGLFETLANSLPALVWISDITRARIWFNRSWLTFTGRPLDDEFGLGWASGVHPEDYERCLDTYNRHFDIQTTFEMEYRLRHHSGEYRWLQDSGGPRYNEAGEFIGFSGASIDIHEHKHIEAALREAKTEAEAANLAKTEFLANVSHELRTPMNAVIGLAHILAASAPLTPKQTQFVTTLQSSADSLMDLINDLLDIAKIESRSLTLERIAFRIEDVIAEITTMMGLRAEEKGLSLQHIRHDPIGTAPAFIGDPTRLKQILVNLCSNAIKFTDSGTICITTTYLPRDDDAFDVIIRVSDTGIGIAPDKLDSIFDKFVQADSSINRQYGGTGLGLAITKTLTEAMSGSITVDSAPDLGSTFTLTLPLMRATDEQFCTETTLGVIPRTSSARGYILLVEDNPTNVMVAGHILQSFGYDFDVATSGLEAIEHQSHKTYDAILMDLQMPGMSGLEATPLIRKAERHARRSPCPIIGITAHALAGHRELCLEAGMDDYIAKPFDPAQLEQKLSALIRAARAKPDAKAV